MKETTKHTGERKTLTRALTRMLSSLGTDYPTTLDARVHSPAAAVDKPVKELKLYIRVGYYDRNLLRNTFNVALYGGKSVGVEVWDGIDQRVYVRSLTRALTKQVGRDGILRRDDSGDRLDPDLSLQKNGITSGTSIRFDTSKARPSTTTSEPLNETANDQKSDPMVENE